MTRLAIFYFDNDNTQSSGGWNNISIDLVKFFHDAERIRLYKIVSEETSSETYKIHKNKLIDKINKLIDKYDNILIVKGDEKINNFSYTFRYYKGMDSVGGDLEQTNNNPLNIIQKMIQREDYLAVNTLGYVKNRLNKIEKNYYLRDGGIWVKSQEKSPLYITLECLSLLNIKDFESFNVLV